MSSFDPTISILKSGLQTTIQDLGRLETIGYGVPMSGVMDSASAAQANQLVMNEVDTPCIEMTMIAPTIAFHKSCLIAITGGDISPKLDDNPIEMYTSIPIQAGQVLKFGRLVNGCRGYLAIGGEWKVKQWGNSASACTSFSSILPESQLKKGDTVAIIPNTDTPIISLQKPMFQSELVLLLEKGPEFELFSRSFIAQFFSTTFTVDIDSNRMGYRLNSELHLKENLTITSSGIVPGTIQITPSGMPIVLMRDAQTTGGYPRIAVMPEKGLNLLAQLKPGDRVRFRM